MTFQVMKLLGIKTLIVTNAAGALNQSYKVGDIMIIKDHINLPAFGGNSPLRGKNDERWGPRFPPMNNAYDRSLALFVRKCANELKMNHFIQEGVYVMNGGPAYETIAETRFLRNSGGDAVGMICSALPFVK